MSQWLANQLIKNVVYPLLLRGVTYIVETFLKNSTKKQKQENKKQRLELIAKIKQAKTNAAIIELSRDLHNLSIGKMQSDGK